MLAALETLGFTDDPAWPWSLPRFGLPALAAVALALIVLTVWTYAGVRGATSGRVLTVLGLRLVALLLACLALLRPSLAFRGDQHPPSAVIIVLDVSESMTIQDEPGPQSRWDRLRRLLKDAEPLLQKLRDNKNINIVMYQFAADVADYDPKAKADGNRTDFGHMLHALYERHSRDRNLRGILILSDGADNGTHFPALTEAARWRSLPCPVYTFGFGQPTTADKQRDINFTAINPVPSPVGIKGKLTVAGTLDAPGFENATVTVHLLIDDKEVMAQKETLRKTTGNDVKLTTDAPAVPGEIKVTLRVDPVEGEMTRANNQISTYVTVTKEGLRVLLVYRSSYPEPERIYDALCQDSRIRLDTVWLRSDEPSPDQIDLFRFEKQHYDVIILDDVSAKAVKAANPDALTEIYDLVHNKGAGFMMMGGYNTLGWDWKDSEIAKMLPIYLEEEPDQIDAYVQMEPTKAGLDHYVMRLADRLDENRSLWRQLPKLNGMTRLGRVKDGSTVLATATVGADKQPVLVSQDYGKGRTLAFAGDTTWRWELLGQPESNLGLGLHARFWKQVVLWLGQQDKIEGNAYVKPDMRRVPAGSKLGFKVGLRGKGGKELQDARFEVTAIGPGNAVIPVPTASDKGRQRGTFWKTDIPGEYRLRVKAWPKGADPQNTASQQAEARFIVYQDTSEMARRAADHDFLQRLASNGGGKFHKAADFFRFLKKLDKLPLAQGQPKAELWPEWRRNTLSGFLVTFFLLYVAVLSVEWFLRRHWGLV